MIRLLIILLISTFHLESKSQVSRDLNQKEQSKIEAGVGAIFASTPDFLGSPENTTRFIPFPWFIYRGRFLRSDNEGTRARLKSSTSYELGLSGGGNLPVNSNENEARAGLPDLDFLIGLGPSLIFRIIKENSKQQLNFRLGLRQNFSTDFESRFRSEGLVLEPSLQYWRKLKGLDQVTLFSSLSARIGNESYNDFFYEVTPEFSNASRNAFDAQAGLSDIAFRIGLSYQLNQKVQLFMGGSINDLSLAKNRNSPLVFRTTNFGGVVGFTWLFYERGSVIQ